MGASKTDGACRAIEALVASLQPTDKLPTVRQLCQSLSVSRVTLDRALTQLERRGVILRKHGQGIYAAPARQRTIGLLFSIDPFSITASSHYRLLIDRVAARCQAAGFDVQTYIDPPMALKAAEAGEGWRRLEDDLAHDRVQGILLPASNNHELRLRKYRIPTISFGDSMRSGTGVIPNRGLVVNLGVQALVKRGCRRIGLIHHMEQKDMDRYGDEKLPLFKDHLSQHGMPFNEAWCHIPLLRTEDYGLPSTPTWEEAAYHGAVEMFARPRAADRPDGLLILDDTMTRGVLVALHRAKMELGRDVVIASHSVKGSSTLLGYEDDLIRLEFDPTAMADMGMDMLIALMDGSPLASRLVVQDPQLILPKRAKPKANPSIATKRRASAKTIVPTS